jgi:hypothetical protein
MSRSPAYYDRLISFLQKIEAFFEHDAPVVDDEDRPYTREWRPDLLDQRPPSPASYRPSRAETEE